MKYMRRADRKIKDQDKIKNILDSAAVARIAINDEKYPYIVPMNYGCDFDGAHLTLYFHCALEGTRIDLLKKNNFVSFEIDIDEGLIRLGDTACSYSFLYASIVGFGQTFFIDDPKEKAQALSKIVSHLDKSAQHKDFAYDDDALNRVCVFKIEADSFTAKARSF